MIQRIKVKLPVLILCLFGLTLVMVSPVLALTCMPGGYYKETRKPCDPDKLGKPTPRNYKLHSKEQLPIGSIIKNKQKYGNNQRNKKGLRTPIQKLPVPKIQKRDLYKTDTGAGKIAKHKRDIISGKFDGNPLVYQLFAIIEEQFDYEQSLVDGSTFGYSPQLPGANDQSVPFYTMLCNAYHIEGLDALGRYAHATFPDSSFFDCGTTSQLLQCDVDNHRETYTDRSTGRQLNRGRDISSDLLLGGTSLAKCFCKFASRLDPRATVDFRSTHNDDSPIDIPPIYEGVCADIFAQ